MFAAVEPCGSFDVVGNRATKRPEVVRRRRKCADRLAARRWPRLLNNLARWVNPHLVA